MIAKTLEELLVYQKALQMWDAVNAILKAPKLQQDLRLHSQIRDASEPTDRAFARYLFISKASAAEVRTRLLLAKKRGYIPEEMCKKATGLAKYLLESNRTDRGLGRNRSVE